jgi:hypothetical protein
MKFRLSKSIASLIGFTLVTVAIQYSETAWADQDLLEHGEISNTKIQEPVVNRAEGIEFTTLTPDKPLEIPKEGGKPVPIQLGIRITNNSSVEREFLLAPGQPIFLEKNQAQSKIQEFYAVMSTVLISRERFGKILKPGESIDIFEQAYILQRDHQILISYTTTLGVSCNFIGFSEGTYSVTMNYQGFYNKLWTDKKIWKKDIKATSSKLTLLGVK